MMIQDNKVEIIFNMRHSYFGGYYDQKNIEFCIVL